MLGSVAKILGSYPVVLLYAILSVYTISPRQITKGYAVMNMLISLCVATSFLWWVG